MIVKKENLFFYYDAKNNISNTEHSDATTTWYDLSNKSNNGIINNCVWGDNCLFFDGINSWVNCGVPNCGSELTFEIAFQVSSNQDTSQTLGGNCESGGFYLQIKKDLKLTAGAYYDGTYHIAESSINANEFVYATMVIKNNTIYLYKNGILEQSITIDGAFSLNVTSVPFAIGTNPGNSLTEFFRGKIYVLRLYDIALTESEVYNNFETEIKNFQKEEQPEQTNNVSKIRIGLEKPYNIKDSYSRANKLNKNEDDTAYAVINFINGLKINEATVIYDSSTNTIKFL